MRLILAAILRSLLEYDDVLVQGSTPIVGVVLVSSCSGIASEYGFLE